MEVFVRLDSSGSLKIALALYTEAREAAALEADPDRRVLLVRLRESAWSLLARLMDQIIPEGADDEEWEGKNKTGSPSEVAQDLAEEKQKITAAKKTGKKDV